MRTAEFGGAAIHGNLSQLAFDRKPKFEIYFRRRFGPGEFNLPHDRAGFRLRLQCEADAAPSRGGLLDADLLSGHHPLAWNALGQVEPVFVRIFEYQHPACDERNGLLRGNAVQRRVPSNASHLAGRPTPARVAVIAMRVEE